MESSLKKTTTLERFISVRDAFFPVNPEIDTLKGQSISVVLYAGTSGDKADLSYKEILGKLKSHTLVKRPWCLTNILVSSVSSTVLDDTMDGQLLYTVAFKGEIV